VKILFVERDVEYIDPMNVQLLSALAKPALIPWAAGQERDAVLLALREILARDPALLVHASPETVVEAVQGRMGYARAHLKTTRDAMDIGTQAHALIQDKTMQMMGGESRAIGDPGYFELPPEPPPGIFDVRFTSQRILETFSRVPVPGARYEYPIILRSAVYPVMIRWDLSDIAGRDLKFTLGSGISENPLRQVMEGTGSVTIREKSTQTFVITVTGLTGRPDIFSLNQNYPNPFNSSTVITFSLPKGGPVKLTVFDILGREVARLVDEEREPGVQTVSFDASGLSSGIYTYRITAGTDSRAKKMLLLR